MNPQARQMAELRAAVTRAIREELHARGYLEAETPVLQTLHGGANARPFVTHMNAYNMELYLRIALELYLKRLVVGGIERVYEIGRIFRNEGADATHNPEFTMLEAYEAYGDYGTMAVLTQQLIQASARAGLGGTVVRRPDGTEFDIGGEWPSANRLRRAVRDSGRADHAGHRAWGAAQDGRRGRGRAAARLEPGAGGARAL